MPNASEEFRSAMAGMQHEEMNEAAIAGFERIQQERANATERAVLPQDPGPPGEAVSAPTDPAQAPTGEPEDPAIAEPQEPTPGVEAPPGVPGVDDEDDPIIDMGGGESVRFSELVKGGMRQQDYTRKTQEVAAQRRQLETERETAMALIRDEASRLQQLTSQMERYVGDPYNHAELERLRVTDGEQYLLKRQEMADQQALAHAAHAEQQRLFQQELQAAIPRERYAMGAALPEFAGERFDAAYKATGDYATGPGGLRPDEWSQLVDHRHVILVEKARRYDELTRQSPRLPRKLANVPRSVRPGAASELRPKGHAAKAEYDAALAKQRDSGGDIRSTADAFLAREKSRNTR